MQGLIRNTYLNILIDFYFEIVDLFLSTLLFSHDSKPNLQLAKPLDVLHNLRLRVPLPQETEHSDQFDQTPTEE